MSGTYTVSGNTSMSAPCSRTCLADAAWSAFRSEASSTRRTRCCTRRLRRATASRQKNPRESPRMDELDRDTLPRMAAFEHVRKLGEIHDHLTATELKPGFVFAGERIPLINPQRGIFKPQQMRYLLSIKTV